MDRIGKTGSNSTFIAIIGMQEKKMSQIRKHCQLYIFATKAQTNRKSQEIKKRKKERKCAQNLSARIQSD